MTANPIEAHQICSTCEQAIRHGLGDLKYVPGLIKRIISEELWRVRKVETGDIVELKSFRELIVGKFPRGWDADLGQVEALLKDDAEALALWRSLDQLKAAWKKATPEERGQFDYWKGAA